MLAPILSAACSALLPGTGQWANGERVKAAALWAMVLGVAGSVWLALDGPAAMRSRVSAGLLMVVYVCVWLPAITDAYQVAAGRAEQSWLGGGRRWYVVMLLFTVGPMALPFLWQSPRFSPRAKWVWTAAVLLITVVSLWVVLAVGPVIERLIGPAARPPA